MAIRALWVNNVQINNQLSLILVNFADILPNNSHSLQLILINRQIIMSYISQILAEFWGSYDQHQRESRDQQNEHIDDVIISKWDDFKSQPFSKGRRNQEYDQEFQEIYKLYKSISLPTVSLSLALCYFLSEKKVFRVISNKRYREIMPYIQRKELQKAQITTEDIQILSQELKRHQQDDPQHIYRQSDLTFKHFFLLQLKMQVMMFLKPNHSFKLMCQSIFGNVRSICTNNQIYNIEDIIRTSIQKIDKIMWKHFAVRSILHQKMSVILFSEHRTPIQNQGDSIKIKRLIIQKYKTIIELLKRIQNLDFRQINEPFHDLSNIFQEITQENRMTGRQIIEEIISSEFFSTYKIKYGAQFFLRHETLLKMFNALIIQEKNAFFNKYPRQRLEIDSNFRRKYQQSRDKTQHNQHIMEYFKSLTLKLRKICDDFCQSNEVIREISKFLSYLPYELQEKYEQQFSSYKTKISKNIETKIIQENCQKIKMLKTYFSLQTNHSTLTVKIQKKFNKLKSSNNIEQLIKFVGLLTSIYDANDILYSQMKGKQKLQLFLERIMQQYKQLLLKISHHLNFSSIWKKQKANHLKQNIHSFANIFVTIFSLGSKTIPQSYYNQMLNQITMAFKHYPANYLKFKQEIQTRESKILIEEFNEVTTKSILILKQNATQVYDIISLINSEMMRISQELIDPPHQIKEEYLLAFEQIAFLKQPLKEVDLQLTQVSKELAQLTQVIGKGIFNCGDQFIPNLTILKKLKNIRVACVNKFLQQNIPQYQNNLIHKISKQLKDTLQLLKEKMKDAYTNVGLLNTSSLAILDELNAIIESKYAIFRPEEQIEIIKIINEYKQNDLKDHIQILKDQIAQKDRQQSANTCSQDEENDTDKSFDMQSLRRNHQESQKAHENQYQTSQFRYDYSFIQSQVNATNIFLQPREDLFEHKVCQINDNDNSDNTIPKIYTKDNMKIKLPLGVNKSSIRKRTTYLRLFFRYQSKLLQVLYKHGKLCSIKRTKNRIKTTELKGDPRISIYKGNYNLAQAEVLKRQNSLKAPECYIYCIARGIGQFQAKGIYHGDIRFRNTIAITDKTKVRFKLIDYDKVFLVDQFSEIKSIFQAWLDSGQQYQKQIFQFIFGRRYHQVLERLDKIKSDPECKDKMKYIMKQLRLEMMRSHLQQLEYLVRNLLKSNSIKKARQKIILQALRNLKANTKRKIKQFSEDGSLFDMDTYNSTNYEAFAKEITCQQAQ